ncbi:hypothetical protein [Mucilaginibacter sp. FT3.2]|uniref:hypothetical protein n=1 Tax=Mucilaginibacter sp. FT3.2 TaxID=2723090 RepID=UPI0016086157|nr:hypothetical protein [Mucilaginibacter sp. FT3.2]MBB6234956.1 hypothetical protein [Mucilaginibacter sp. FT3.2]
MKKLLTTLLLSVLSFGVINAHAAPVKHHHKHLRKDGKPDKRYKTAKTHLKKDGKPDRRFKENKIKH